MKRVPWNKGKRGLQIAWNKGLTKETDERVRRYSEKLPSSRRGMKLSASHRKNIGRGIKGRKPWNKGKETPAEVKQKIRKSTLGKKNHFYGKIHSEKSKKSISYTRKGKCVGENHPTCKYFLNSYKKEIIKIYKKGDSGKRISKKFGVSDVTLFNYFKKWGVKRRRSFYGQGTIICEDGHKVLSNPERLIDNFLFFNGINHETNKRILNTRYMYDFYIPDLDLYIEYWGIENSETYCKRRDKKLKIYKKNELDLLSIRPNEDINKKLGFLIPLCATKQKTIYT